MMRVRLRAPGDESEPLPAATPVRRASLSAQASPRTPPPRLPQVLDVRSPDFIEQRLENLKRKPNWLTYLDQYVQAYPEDEDENGGEDAAKPSTEEDADGDGGYDADDEAADDEDDGPGYFRSLVYAVGVVALTPVWAVTFPLWRNKGPDFWPLGSPSLWDLYKRSLWLLALFVLAVELMYFVICKELPEWGRETWYVLQVELEDMLDATNACRAAVSRGSEVLIRELCAPIGIDIAVLQLTAWTMVKTHRRWGRVVLLVLAGLIFVDVPGKINMALQPLPVISGIDQPYALLDEEILVAFTGKNLQPGGTIAWVSYWGCASTSPVTTCDLQFPATFDKGFAAVTFTAIDQFIPCYRNPPNPLKAEDFLCFDHIRLPVKDKQSIPGWSRGNQGAVKATKHKKETKSAVFEPTMRDEEAILDHERAEEIAYARRLAEENERVKGSAPAKSKDEKRTSNRSKKKKPQQKIKSVVVDPATGNAKDER